MSAAFPPNPALHTDPEIEKRCPYCHPKPKPEAPPEARAHYVDFNGLERLVPSAAQQARHQHRLALRSYVTTGGPGDGGGYVGGGGGTESM